MAGLTVQVLELADLDSPQSLESADLSPPLGQFTPLLVIDRWSHYRDQISTCHFCAGQQLWSKGTLLPPELANFVLPFLYLLYVLLEVEPWDTLLLRYNPSTSYFSF